MERVSRYRDLPEQDAAFNVDWLIVIMCVVLGVSLCCLAFDLTNDNTARAIVQFFRGA